jgi:hypothetical protein
MGHASVLNLFSGAWHNCSHSNALLHPRGSYFDSRSGNILIHGHLHCACSPVAFLGLRLCVCVCVCVYVCVFECAVCHDDTDASLLVRHNVNCHDILVKQCK